MTSDPSNIPLCITLIVLAVILNGLVVLSNSAMDSVSRNKLKNMPNEEAGKKVDRLIKLLDKPYKIAYTNRLLNFIFYTAEVVIALEYLPYNKIATIAILVVVTLSLSEYFARKLAVQHSENIAIAFVGLQSFMCVVLWPILWVLVLIANIFLKLFRQETTVDQDAFSEEDVMSMLEVGQETGVIKEEGKKMINSIFEFDDELAYEIMTPRTDVFMIDINDPTEEYLDELMELRYSRIPVCEGGNDNIIGILHIKDYLIKAREDGFENVDIHSILRKAYLVPETKNIDSLFFELQKSKQHIAILIDEYGGFSGIVTMEDIIEEVMGDIDDEYDLEEHVIKKLNDTVYLVDGNVDIDDIDEELGISLESDNSETIGGFIIDILGEIPEEKDVGRTVEFENYLFKIMSVKERRIEQIKIIILPKKTEEDEAE